MPYRQWADAGAQNTCASPITNSQTTVTLQSASGFPAIVSNGQLSVIIWDSGALGYVQGASPFTVNNEYQPVNGIAGNVLTFGPGGGGASRAAYAGTTPKAYSAGATIAVVSLAEDIVASAPWKYDDQLLAASASSIRIPASGSIPASYLGVTFRHIQIKWQSPNGTAASTPTVNLQLNGDTGSNYSYSLLEITGSTVSGIAGSGANHVEIGALPGTNSAAGAVSGGTLDIFNYSSAVAHAIVGSSWRGDNALALGMENVAANWFSSNVVTSIVVFPSAGQFAAGTLFTTYLIP